MNKVQKIVSFVILAGVLLAFAAPALAQIPNSCTMRHTIVDCPAKGADASMDTQGMCCLLNTIYSITNWVFMLLIAVAMLFVVLGAFNFVTAGGNAEQTQVARNYIMYAAIGLAIGLLAKAVPSIVRMMVGI